MIISTHVIAKVYHSLDFRFNSPAMGVTCDILSPVGNCPNCPAHNKDTAKCGFNKNTNPDFNKSFDLFYEKYPEYLI